MRMRCQAVERWRDDASKERHSVVFKYINILDVNISKSLRICATYKLILAIDEPGGNRNRNDKY
jgi:hypothetical protein